MLALGKVRQNLAIIMLGKIKIPVTRQKGSHEGRKDATEGKLQWKKIPEGRRAVKEENMQWNEICNGIRSMKEEDI